MDADIFYILFSVNKLLFVVNRARHLRIYQVKFVEDNLQDNLNWYGYNASTCHVWSVLKTQPNILEGGFAKIVIGF